MNKKNLISALIISMISVSSIFAADAPATTAVTKTKNTTTDEVVAPVDSASEKPAKPVAQ